MNRIKGIWKFIGNSVSLDTKTGRSSHTVNLLNNKIYVFGGEHEPRVPIEKTFIYYDLVTSKWGAIEDGPQTPVHRLGHAMCAVSDEWFYVFGGRNAVKMGSGSLNDLHEFNAKTHEWKVIDEGTGENAPIARSYHAMASLDDRVYVFGGCAVDRLNDFHCYDLKLREWIQLNKDDRIQPRGGSAICAFKDAQTNEGFIYLIGGFCGDELSNCFVYSVAENRWSEIAPLPHGISVFALAQVNDNRNGIRMILHGGEIGPSRGGHEIAGQFSGDTYAFDGTSWLKVETQEAEIEMPCVRAWHSATYSNGKFYVYGGLNQNNERLDDLYELELVD